MLKNKSKCVRENIKLQDRIRILEEQILNQRRKTDAIRKKYERIMKKNDLEILTSETKLTPRSKAKKTILDSFGKDLPTKKKKYNGL